MWFCTRIVVNFWGDDFLFCILVNHGEELTVLVPRTKEYLPWKEVKFGHLIVK